MCVWVMTQTEDKDSYSFGVTIAVSYANKDAYTVCLHSKSDTLYYVDRWCHMSYGQMITQDQMTIAAK